MIWFPEAAEKARGGLRVALHACGRCSEVLARALNENGIRARLGR